MVVGWKFPKWRFFRSRLENHRTKMGEFPATFDDTGG